MSEQNQIENHIASTLRNDAEINRLTEGRIYTMRGIADEEINSSRLERRIKARRIGNEVFELIHDDGSIRKVAAREFRCLQSDEGGYVYGITTPAGTTKYYEAYLER